MKRTIEKLSKLSRTIKEYFKPTRKLWVDFETFSSNDIVKGGAYKYFESYDFEIMMMAYAFDNGPVKLVDFMYLDESWPQEVLDAFTDDYTAIYARNANFERLALKAQGIDVPIWKFRCTAAIAAANGLPLSLAPSGAAVGLPTEKQKDARGKALIKYFSIPCKPTKVNGGRFRNLPHHDLEKWNEFCDYCIQDVEADRNIYNEIFDFVTPDEWKMYALDQKINDRGVLIDTKLVNNAIRFDNIFKSDILERLTDLTGLSNPNSVTQLKDWLNSELDENLTSLTKDTVSSLIGETLDGSTANEVLRCRKMAAKTSVRKYYAMLECLCDDGRAHGLFQFLGAMRTGRWAGRLIQLQNLPQNKIKDLDDIRNFLLNLKYDAISERYEDMADVLSQLIRTALIAPEGKTNAVADFSAIEARVIAWLSSESWRMDVFNSHGMIYEASAASMFNVDINTIQYIDSSGEKIQGVNYDMRAKGKVAELALGYQGGWRALETMGGSKMGLSQEEMEEIVKLWRLSNKNIVSLWYDLERCAIQAVKMKTRIISKFRGLEFNYEHNCLTIKLPSGRKLSYYKAFIGQSRFGKDCVKYYGVNDKKQWVALDTYGGKLVENVVQAIARDCLVVTLLRLDEAGYPITMHVHDEIVSEVPKNGAQKYLDFMCGVMSDPIPWAKDLPLTADGYLTDYYKKD